LLVQSPSAATCRRWTLILCCLAQFMVVLDVAVVNVALPSIQRDLRFSDVNLQWIVSAYTLTFAGFLLLGGRAADLLGHKRVFIGGLALFGVASLTGGLSGSQGALIASRGLQGLGGAVVAPVTLSILTTTFTEGSERNRALAAWGAMGAAGGAAGGLIGGILTDLLGWQWILFINVPIAIGACLAAQRFISELVAERGQRHYDIAGAVTVTAGLVLLTFAIVRTDVNGWGSATTLGTMAGGLGLLGVFLFIEARISQRPLMPLNIFSARSVSGANIVVFFMGSSAFAMWFFVSRYLQNVLGYTPIEAGLSFLPMTASIATASTIAGRLLSPLGPGRILTFGMSLLALGMFLFSFVSADGSFLGDVLVPGVVTATGLGFSFVPVTVAATAGVTPDRAGLASGLVNTSRQFGGSVGLAVLATIAATSTHGTSLVALTHGFHVAFLVGAAFALTGALVSGGVLVRAPRVAVASPSVP
jgi:EmrB/QacA subfamily drug resistance transporter